MSNMSKQNRKLFMAIMIASLMQMVQFALTPGIAKMHAEVFPTYPLFVIQTAMTLPSLLSMVFSLVSAFLIGKGWISKKASVIIGLALITGTSFIAMLLHDQFWHLCLFSVLIGMGMGFFISTSASIMFDNFNEAERRASVGAQTSFINFGGIIMSAGGGYLASRVWYGGYLMLLIGIPIIIICILAISNDKIRNSGIEHHQNEQGQQQARIKIPADIFYYGAITFIFLLIYVVCGTNISNHLQAANIGDTATAGIATAIQMAGGVAAGFVFNKISAKFKDYALAIGFFIIFVGYTIINLGQSVLLIDFIGVFIVGTAISIIIPQSLFSTSNRVNSANSAVVTAIVNTIFPGFGGFLSPIVFTNLTIALGGDSTNFRFEFVGIVALVIGIVLVFTTHMREMKVNSLVVS